MATYREEEDPFEEDIVFDQTGLLNSSSKMNTAIRRVSSGKCVLFAKTLGLCGAFFGLGLCIAIPGPTFLSPLMELESHLSPVSKSYIARTCGYVLGSLIGGVLFDRFNRLFLLFLSLLLTAVFITVTPWCQVVWLLETCMIILGITMGFLDTGGNVLCLDLWGRNSGPFMQALHFSFGLGAFVAPLLAAPFLEPTFSNSTLSTELSHAITELPVHLENHHILKRDVDISNMSVVDSLKIMQRSDLSLEKPVVPMNNIVLNVSTTTPMPDLHVSSPSTVQSTVSVSSTSFKPKKSKPSKTDGSKLENRDMDRFRKPPPADLLPLSTTVASTSVSSPSPPSPATIGSVSSSSPVSITISTTADSSPSTSFSSASPSSRENSETYASAVVSSNDNVTSAFGISITAASIQNISSPLSLTFSLPLSSTSNPLSGPLGTSISPGVPLSTETTETYNTVSTNNQSDNVINNDFRIPVANSSVSVISAVPSSSEEKQGHKVNENSVDRKHIVEDSSQMSHELEARTKVHSSLETNAFSESLEVKSPDSIVAIKNLESTTPLVYAPPLSLNRRKDGREGVNDSGGQARSDAVSLKPKNEDMILGNTDSTTKQTLIDAIVTSKIKEQDSQTYKEPVNPITTLVPKHIHHKPGTFDNDTEHINTILDIFANRIEKYGFSKIQFTYLIVGIFVFSISLVFLGFLCHNPRDPKSKQQEGHGVKKITNKIVHKLLITFMAFFFFLYMGLQVTYGQLVLAFAMHSSLQLPQSTDSAIPVVFWGSFAAMRFASIFFASGFDPVTMLMLNFAFCTAGTVLVSALASHFATALWVGTALIGVGLASMFPTGILWIERYIHVSNKVAAVFVIGVALGELICPVTIYQLMVIEPMLFAYATLVINILCILTFAALWWLASRNGEKYSVISNNGYQLASQHDEEEDMIDMSPSGSGVLLQRHSFSSEQRALLNGNIHRGP